MRSHAYLAIIAALIAATESALPSHQERKGADQTSLLNEAILEAIKATSTSEPASFVNQVRKGAAPIRILNTNNEEMGMLQLKVTTYMTRIIEREFSSVDILGLTVTESL
eukprot:scaffold190416_cov23-Cyclotella_meneghiniana.AAC.1